MAARRQVDSEFELERRVGADQRPGRGDRTWRRRGGGRGDAPDPRDRRPGLQRARPTTGQRPRDRPGLVRAQHLAGGGATRIRRSAVMAIHDAFFRRTGRVEVIRERIPTAVLGATGSVGQRMVALLADHPWFELVEVTASQRSAGRAYKDAVQLVADLPDPSIARRTRSAAHRCRLSARVGSLRPRLRRRRSDRGTIAPEPVTWSCPTRGTTGCARMCRCWCPRSTRTTSQLIALAAL